MRKLAAGTCRGQQHGDVTIMAACVHDAGAFRGVRRPTRFLHRQGIHVRADPEAATGRPAAKGAHDAGSGQPPMDTEAPTLEP